MPIKELIALTVVVMTGIFAANPLRFQENLQKVKFQILREATRTDTWGSPSIFAHRRNSPGYKSYSQPRRTAKPLRRPDETETKRVPSPGRRGHARTDKVWPS